MLLVSWRLLRFLTQLYTSLIVTKLWFRWPRDIFLMYFLMQLPLLSAPATQAGRPELKSIGRSITSRICFVCGWRRGRSSPAGLRRIWGSWRWPAGARRLSSCPWWGSGRRSPWGSAGWSRPPCPARALCGSSRGAGSSATWPVPPACAPACYAVPLPWRRRCGPLCPGAPAESGKEIIIDSILFL